MNAPLQVGGASRRSVFDSLRVAALSVASLVLVHSTHAQAASHGRVSGRIFNPVTQEYVRAAQIRVTGTDLVAYSGDDGRYVLTGVPPGEVGLTVTYTGYDPVSTTVSVAANGAATQNFDLKGTTYQLPAAGAKAS